MEIYEGPVWTLAETPDYSVSASTDEPSWRDDLDVEHVELYRIHQDGPGTP